ncbi:ferrochelatase, mitochondrial, partial [Asbolus verrucosus]
MGGPQKLEQVHDYLNQIMTDRDMIQLPFAQNYLGPWIAKRRTPEVQKKYEEIGGGSPILKWTNKQGELLCKRLDIVSPKTAPHKHYVAFRYVPPYAKDAFTELERDGVKHAVIFSQYPQYSCATSGSSFNAIYQHFKQKYITVTVIKQCSNKHKIVVHCQRTVNRGDPYPSEVGATVQMVMEELEFCNPYQLVWQSKVGPLPWLGPFTDDAIAQYMKKGKKNFVIVPIAFVNEHIETLHELDIEYCKELAEKVGVEEIRRVPTPNDHPLFIEALTSIVNNHLQNKIAVGSKFLHRCPHCVNASCYHSKKWYSEV